MAAQAGLVPYPQVEQIFEARFGFDLPDLKPAGWSYDHQGSKVRLKRSDMPYRKNYLIRRYDIPAIIMIQTNELVFFILHSFVLHLV